jgi:hypothetical protein
MGDFVFSRRDRIVWMVVVPRHAIYEGREQCHRPNYLIEYANEFKKGEVVHDPNHPLQL